MVKILKDNWKKISKWIVTCSLALSVLGALGVAIYGVTDTDHARKTLQDQKMTDIDMKGRASFLDCKGNGAFYRTAFSAVNQKGERINGVVCQGTKFTGRKAYISLVN